MRDTRTGNNVGKIDKSRASYDPKKVSNSNGRIKRKKRIVMIKLDVADGERNLSRGRMTRPKVERVDLKNGQWVISQTKMI